MLAARSVGGAIAFLGLLVQLASGGDSTATFTSGDLFYAANRPGAAIYNIAGGGDLIDALAYAPGGGPADASLGQMAWSNDLTRMYTTNFVGNTVYQVDAEGNASLYAEVPEPLGIVVTASGRILVTSYRARKVLDITDPLNVSTFATLPTIGRNMRQLPSGEILVAGSSGKVFDIASGSATVFASIDGASSSYLGDIDFTSDGRVFVTGGFASENKVYEITGGGQRTSPFATLVNAPSNGGAFGLAIDQRNDQILVAPLGANYVVNVTAGGLVDASVASLNRFAWNIPTTNDMAIDCVPWRPRSGSVSAVSTVASLPEWSPDRFASYVSMTGGSGGGFTPPPEQPVQPPEHLPEPGTLAIWGLGALVCAAAAYRRTKPAA